MVRELISGEKIDVLTGVCSSAVMLAESAVSGELKVPVYVGKASKVDGYDFPILTEVEKFEGAPLMPSKDFILKAREAAK